MLSPGQILRYPKILLVAGVLCIPLLVLAGLFVNQSFKDVRFSQRELSGVARLRPVWQTLSQCYAGEAGRAPPLSPGDNEKLGLADEQAAFARDLAARGPDADCARAETPVRTFMTQISDASYLTLDPDIDSYYLMATAVTGLPETAGRSRGLLRAFDDTSPDARIRAHTELALLNLASANSYASMSSAMRGNTDSRVSAAITPALIRFRQAQDAYLAQARRQLGEPASPAQAETLRPYYLAVHTSTDALWQAVAGELERLLKARVAADLARLWWLLALALVIAGGAVAIIVYLDLRIQHSQTLKLNTSLRQSNEELERFAFICSHDLQEPVRMMSVYAGMLAADAGDRLSADEHRYIAYIRDNARRMQKMISDILDFARIGRETVSEERVDCNAVLQRVLGEFGDTIQARSAVVTHTALPVLTASPTVITLLLQNLIGNALKFQDGRHPPEIHISAAREGANWRFEVRDNGIGIDEAFRETVFALFKRLNRKEDYPGTGIGLSACRKYLRIYGGELDFTSRPGQGSLFFFTLPAKD